MQVVRVGDLGITGLRNLLQRFGLTLQITPDGQTIPGSFWGDEEAGLIDDQLLARQDTPIHSVLHEACHYICMDRERRLGLHTNAGGDYDEENAVCYLQILLADHISGFSSQRMLEDMDTWGYTFRLGSAAKWFFSDAEDAQQLLRDWGIIDVANNPTFQLREDHRLIDS